MVDHLWLTDGLLPPPTVSPRVRYIAYIYVVRHTRTRIKLKVAKVSAHKVEKMILDFKV